MIGSTTIFKLSRHYLMRKKDLLVLSSYVCNLSRAFFDLFLLNLAISKESSWEWYDRWEHFWSNRFSCSDSYKECPQKRFGVWFLFLVCAKNDLYFGFCSMKMWHLKDLETRFSKLVLVFEICGFKNYKIDGTLCSSPAPHFEQALYPS